MVIIIIDDYHLYKYFATYKCLVFIPLQQTFLQQTSRDDIIRCFLQTKSLKLSMVKVVSGWAGPYSKVSRL